MLRSITYGLVLNDIDEFQILHILDMLVDVLIVVMQDNSVCLIHNVEVIAIQRDVGDAVADASAQCIHGHGCHWFVSFNNNF